MRPYVLLSTPMGSGINESWIIDYQPVRSRQNQEVFGITWEPPPLSLIHTLDEEGVNMPMQPHRWWTGQELPPGIHELSRKHRWIALDVAFQEGTPQALIETPADATVFDTSAYLYELPESLRTIRIAQAHRALTTDVDFTWPGVVPWTSWGVPACTLLDEVQRHLLIYPPDNGKTWDLWTQAEVLRALNDRLAKFYVDTGLVLERRTQEVSANPVDLTGVLRIRRVRFSGIRLDPIDRFLAGKLSSGWETTPGTPLSYIDEVDRLYLVPTPSSGATLDLLVIPAPPEVKADCADLPLPDLFVPAIKWGVLSDLLSKEGEANDPVRARRAEARYLEGVVLAQLLLGSPPDASLN